MLGLIFKISLFFAIIIGAVLIVLNVSNAWNPGTLSFSKPDVAICQRWLAANRPNREPRSLEVRWIWTAKDYGWGCHIDWGELESESVSPMPEI